MVAAPVTDAIGVPIEGLMAEKVDDIVLVRVDQVRCGDRLRAIDPVWAAALGDIMRRDGQKTPIEVCRLPGRSDFELVAGAHRHAGAKLADIVYLRAIIVGADAAERRMREIAENLWRRELDPVDRASFIAELVSLKRTQAGLDVASIHVGRVNDRFRKRVDAEADGMLDTMSSIYGWSDDIAEQIGISSRTVRRDLMIFRGVPPSLIQRLRDGRHPILKNATQLRALARHDEAMQRGIVDRLMAGASLSEAVAMIRGSNRPVDAGAKRLSAFVGAFSRMALTEKKGALAEHRRGPCRGHRRAARPDRARGRAGRHDPAQSHPRGGVDRGGRNRPRGYRAERQCHRGGG